MTRRSEINTYNVLKPSYQTRSILKFTALIFQMALLLQIAYGQFFKSLNTLARTKTQAMTKTYTRLDAKSANFQKIIKMLFRLHSIQHPYLSKNKRYETLTRSNIVMVMAIGMWKTLIDFRLEIEIKNKHHHPHRILSICI